MSSLREARDRVEAACVRSRGLDKRLTQAKRELDAFLHKVTRIYDNEDAEASGARARALLAHGARKLKPLQAYAKAFLEAAVAYADADREVEAEKAAVYDAHVSPASVAALAALWAATADPPTTTTTAVEDSALYGITLWSVALGAWTSVVPEPLIDATFRLVRRLDGDGGVAWAVVESAPTADRDLLLCRERDAALFKDEAAALRNEDDEEEEEEEDDTASDASSESVA